MSPVKGDVCGEQIIERKAAMTWMLIRILLLHYNSTFHHFLSFPSPHPIFLKSVTNTLFLSDSTTSSIGLMATTTLNPSFHTHNLDNTFKYYPHHSMSGGSLEALPELSAAEIQQAFPNPPTAKTEPLKHDLLPGANASENTIMKEEQKPLSPASGGARTPKAQAASLQTQPSATARDPKTADLANNMDDLKVYSPAIDNTDTPSISQVFSNAAESKPAVMQPPHRTFSSSTEGSTSMSNPVTTTFGTSYGPEGFPLTTNVTEEGKQMTAQDLQMSAQAAAAIAAADEAIKQLNGTSTVIQGPPALPAVGDPYILPRGYANFVNPQTKSDRMRDFNIHRQSSTSSSVTEASTSSEESDLCIPSIEWVTAANVASPPSGNAYLNSPYAAGANIQFQPKGAKSPGRMAPPALTGRDPKSPRRASVDRPAPPHQASLPLGATAHSPGGTKDGGSALPSETDPAAPAEEDDDEQTVGNGRDRSPSTSSQSNRSGLDLLWRAVHHPKPEGPNVNSPYEQQQQGYDGKGKRKAVAQWRKSGIPTGESSPEDDSAQIDPELKGSGLPKKRRRSEITMDAIDPMLRDEEAAFGDAEEAPAMDADMVSEAESDDSGASLDSQQDPEYTGEPGPFKGKATYRSKATGGKKGGKAGGRASTGTAASNGIGGSSKGNGKRARKTDSPNGGGGGGGGGGPRKSSASAAGQVLANVQCEYVNPLPVSHLVCIPSVQLTYSLTTDARMSSPESTIFPVIWPDMLDERESWSTRANCPRTRRYCGRRSRTSQRSLATRAERALPGE